jgi:hypothetical protein
MTNKKKAKKRKDEKTLASVTKEMARPRFVESARKDEEEAHDRNHGRLMNT